MGNDIFSYTKRDYEGSRQEGLAKIPELSNGVWTDLNPTDPGIIILDYVHALVDMINYYQDHQALETFIATAKERQNVFRIAKQLSYSIRSAKSARVEVTFTSHFSYDHTIRIPKYTRVSTKDGVTYVTSKDAYLKAGETEVSVLCLQGRVYTAVYDGSTANLGSDSEHQSFTLTTENIDISTITAVDKLGRTWSPVDFIVFSNELDRVYQPELNPDNTVTIRFGNGERGIAPSDTDEITFTYIAGDAENGRVGAGAIINSDTIYDNGEYVEITIGNEEASVGGSSAQSSSEIKELAPGAIKAQDRAVTLSDFENLAKLVDGVESAKAYDINVNPSIPYHEVRVLIIPKEGSSSKVLLTEVYNYLYKRMIPPTNLQVLFPSSVSIDVNITVKKLDNTDSGALEYTIREVVESYFKEHAKEVGEDYYPADLAASISRIDNVRYVVSMTPSNAVTIEDLAIAVLGNLTINVQ